MFQSRKFFSSPVYLRGERPGCQLPWQRMFKVLVVAVSTIPAADGYIVGPFHSPSSAPRFIPVLLQRQLFVRLSIILHEENNIFTYLQPLPDEDSVAKAPKLFFLGGDYFTL
jgi:hypothetical protein